VSPPIELRRSEVSATLKGVPVLIVEDSWYVAKALKRSLEQLEMHVIGPTATAAEAKDLAAKQRPRLAIVDVNIREGDTTDLIDHLHRQDVRVIVVSGYGRPRIPRNKAAAFLQKPYSGNELIAAMCGALDPSR
jgi:DNA-binding NarL/FixJ family response regulator